MLAKKRKWWRELEIEAQKQNLIFSSENEIESFYTECISYIDITQASFEEAVKKFAPISFNEAINSDLNIISDIENSTSFEEELLKPIYEEPIIKISKKKSKKNNEQKNC